MRNCLILGIVRVVSPMIRIFFAFYKAEAACSAHSGWNDLYLSALITKHLFEAISSCFGMAK